MLNRLVAIPKAYLHFVLVRALLFFALFMGLGLTTMFMASIMFLNWHWKIDCIFAVCMAPWLLAIIILAILTLVHACKFRAKKKALCRATPANLFSQVFSLALGYILKK